jgi:hypothetical protein
MAYIRFRFLFVLFQSWVLLMGSARRDVSLGIPTAGKVVCTER